MNALRGLRDKDEGAGAVGVTETTLERTRYPDADSRNPYVWYDIPGAGTPKCRDWQYFNDQELYAFDCIIIVTDNRFTMTDIAILANARRFNIPTYIVRSKADQHIRNSARAAGYDSDEEDDEHHKTLYETARTQFVDKTRENIKANLKDANLLDQQVYIVSNKTLLNVVLKKIPKTKKMIDEVAFFSTLISEAEIGLRGRPARAAS